MKIHPLLSDPDAVLVFQTPLDGAVDWEVFRLAAEQSMAAMQIELEGEKVVIKPNVTSGERFANPDTGITTHPAFVQGIVEYSQQHGAQHNRITIAEDPRNTDDETRRHWRGTGFDRVSLQTGAKLHSPTRATCVEKVVPIPMAHPRLTVSRLATARSTVLINVPKLKTHNLAITTLCIKNLMGLVYTPDRHYCIQAWGEMPEAALTEPRPRHEWMNRTMHQQWQEGLARRLVDTAQVIRPALNIVEGIIGREGTGFQRGRNRTLGLVVAGVNMVAVDSLVSYLIGFDPQAIPYLKLAARAGLGNNCPGELNVYTGQAGELVRCPDIRALRIDPPFHVISNTVEEDQDPFRQDDPAHTDASDFIFARPKA